MSARSALCIALGAVLTLQIQAQEQRSFVACPIYRDTDQGRKSGCWLADDPATGTRYDVGEWLTKPQEGYEVLVEGIISSEPDVCGGIVLRPVRTAVLHDQHCPLTEFEAEGFSGRRYALPRDVMQQSWVPRPAPQPPFSTQHYLLLFDFADDRLIYQYSETILERAALYSRTSHGRITIRAYAATRLLKISGQALTEPLALARARAEMVNEALLRLGVDRSALHMEWHGEPEPLNPLPAVGAPLPESSLRRVEITVEPQSTL